MKHSNQYKTLLFFGFIVGMVTLLVYLCFSYWSFSFYNGWLQFIAFRIPSLVVIGLWVWLVWQIPKTNRWVNLAKFAIGISLLCLFSFGLFLHLSDLASLVQGKGLSDEVQEVYYKRTGPTGITIIARHQYEPPTVSDIFSISIRRPLPGNIAFREERLWDGYEPPSDDILKKYTKLVEVCH